MIVLPPDILPFFVKAGWYEGRKVALPIGLIEQLSEDHSAIEILSQFGGLTVGETDSGQECARYDVAFVSPLVEPDPEGEEADIKTWNSLLKTQLACIAHVHHHHGKLYVDPNGRCFSLSLIHDAFYFEGESFVEAMRRAMFGLRSRPMLRPDQRSVTIYGIDYDANSPELYRYE